MLVNMFLVFMLLILRMELLMQCGVQRRWREVQLGCGSESFGLLKSQSRGKRVKWFTDDKNMSALFLRVAWKMICKIFL